METKFIINCDGSQSNPNKPDEGIACWAFVVHSFSGERIYAHYGSMGKGVSHNVAEMFAILQAISFCRDFPDKSYTIKSDSKLCIDQLNGSAECRAESLIPYYQACSRLLQSFESDKRPRLEWLPRERNLAADALAKKAHDYFVKSKNVSALALSAWYVDKPWGFLPA